MKKDKIIIVRSTEGDWEALYKNGKLIFENHSVEIQDLIRLNINASDIEYAGEVDEEWCEEIGSFPKCFSNIRFS